ncbi:MAG: lipopolysaccharide transport system ATP-binding protein [Thermoleophilaceae bacterium]|nr:lipopolysaccharide transport system ATP-binding protein [Thermoleophilaceae bacterium]
MSSEPIVRVEDVGKQYRYGAGAEGRLAEALQRAVGRLLIRSTPANRDVFWALRNVSLEVYPGEVVGIIGRNGAGKSTLLKLLARITLPSEGRIVMHGRVASLLEVGAGFDPELSGRENVFLSGAVLGMRRQEILAKFDQIVAFSGIERFIDTPVKRYSSGMFVRLAFAVGAHLESDILLIDEVLAVGDAEFQRRCLAKMDDVAHQGGRTIIFVSHNMSAVRRLCDRAYLLHGGKLAASGSPSEVIAGHLRDAGDRTDGGVAVVGPDAQRIGTGDALLRKATLFDSHGEPGSELGLAEPFALRLEYEVSTRLPASVLEVGVIASDGLQIATAMNTDGGHPAMDLEPGRWLIDLRLDLSMLPGSYAFTVMIHHENGTTVDAVEGILPFSVSQASRDGSEAFPWAQVRGSVRPPSTWRALPASQATAAAVPPQ